MRLENIKSLDGLRALAILLVIIWHYFNCLVSSEELSGKMAYIKYLTFWSWSGVDLFFVLSGFLIGRILIYNKNSKKYFSTFYIRRICRIFPAYYLIIFIFILISILHVDHQIPWLSEQIFPIYSYFLYIQNFWATHLDTFGGHWLSVTWSLAIEEQFYLILPLLIYIIRPNYLPYILLFFILLAPVLRAIIQPLGSYVLLPARMDSLLMGVLIAHYFLNGKLQIVFENRQRKLLLFVVFLMIILFILGRLESIGGVFIHSVLMLIYGALLVLVLTLKSNTFFERILSSRPLAFIGLISYMVYLTHQIFNGLLHQFILDQAPQINNYKDILVTLLALLSTLSFSALSYKYFEKPILRIGKRYEY